MPGKPFSVKQKKQQLRAKREKKQNQGGLGDSDDEGSGSKTKSAHRHGSRPGDRHGDRQGEYPQPSNQKDVERYKLSFERETQEELAERKKAAMRPYQRLSMRGREAACFDFYNPPIMFPLRPAWDYSLSRNQLEQQEHKYFLDYKENFSREHKLGYYELNLETWRQLWRVLEMCDLLLCIIDIRFAALHFNPAVYEHVTKTLKKPMILILNKCDIVDPAIVIAWKHYFLKTYPGIRLVIFTSYPKDEATRQALTIGKQNRRRRKRAPAIGPYELWLACKDIVDDQVDLEAWRKKVLEDMRASNLDQDDSDEESDTEVAEGVDNSAPDLSFIQHQKYKDGILTIGCVGYPNVGKSAVINGLMGKKVVSVSRTPGHTKHFQTIFLTSNVRLCDCPGLVFPSTAPRPIQVLGGMYPIAQLREPYSSVQYLAERCDIVSCLNLKLPEDCTEWSAYLICDALAELKGFKTAKGARNDPYRAANFILRSALEGKLQMCLLPPGFTDQQEMWAAHEEAKELALLQTTRISAVEGVPLQAQDDLEQQSDSEESDESQEDDRNIAKSNAFAMLAESSD